MTAQVWVEGAQVWVKSAPSLGQVWAKSGGVNGPQSRAGIGLAAYSHASDAKPRIRGGATSRLNAVVVAASEH